MGIHIKAKNYFSQLSIWTLKTILYWKISYKEFW